jgi:hypothetical protein
MFSRVRIAIRFFFVGLAVGVLLAPRSGEETRKMLREKADRLLNEVLDAASLGTAQTGSAGTPTETKSTAKATPVDEEAEAPRSPRSSNGGSSGSGRSRSSRSTTSAEASTGSVT